MLFDQKRLVFVVDDEESLLKLNGRILEKAGYSVLLASSSHQALTMFQRHSDQIHLLFSGVEMPVMNGIALADQITAERPGIAVLLTSANPSYAEETRFSFLAQPYNPEKLQMAAAQTLEMHAESGAAVELKAGPVFVTEDSSSRPEIGTPHRQSVETNAFVRQELPPEMAKYYREGRRHLSNVVPEPEPMLPETVVLIRKDHRHSRARHRS